VPEAFVLQTLRTARTKASPRGGFAGISPVDLLVSARAVGSVFMGISADLAATMEGYERAELDAYGLETQRKAARAVAAVSGAAGLGVAVLVERVAS
jgi:hypothetical protein